MCLFIYLFLAHDQTTSLLIKITVYKLRFCSNTVLLGLHEPLCNSVLAPKQCVGSHGFSSHQGLSFCLCPIVVTYIELLIYHPLILHLLAVEFPAVLLNTSTGELESEFHMFVQPSEHRKLSEFCTELTGITQVLPHLYRCSYM